MASEKIIEPDNLDYNTPKLLPAPDKNMYKRKSNKNLPLPKLLPPPNKNMYKRKSNKDLPLPMRLPPPLRLSRKKKSAKSSFLASLPATYNNTNGLLTTNIFPTTNSVSNFKTQSRTPSPKFPKMIIKSNKKKTMNKRCKRGTRRNKITKLCVPNEYYMKKMYTRREYKRCPNGERRNPYNLKCEKIGLFTRNRV
jgi:hypothetical protein